jgi:hypothetical protein
MVRRDIAIHDGAGQGACGHASQPLRGSERCGVAAPAVTESTTYVDTANAAASFHKAEFRGRALTHLFHQYAKKAGAQSFSQSLDLGLFRLPPV